MKLNPVFKNEMKISNRSTRTPFILFLYNAVLAAVSLLVFYSTLNNANYFGMLSYQDMLSLYCLIGYVQFGMLMMIVPALTASSISGERERGTLEILLVTKMKPWQIIWGKLQSSLGTVCMLAVSSMPVIAITFVFGGIGILDLFFQALILLTSAVFVGSVGLFYSTLFKRTTIATIMTYATLGIIFFGTHAMIRGMYGFSEMHVYSNNLEISPTAGSSIYLMLLNPILTFYGLLTSQVGNQQAVLYYCLQYGEYTKTFIINNWVLISMGLQFIVALILLAAAARNINPCRGKAAGP